MEFTFDARGFPEKLIHPRYIFKYVSDNDNTLAALSESYLWFSSPSDFNDPFDCHDTLTFECTKRVLRQFVRHICATKRSSRQERNRMTKLYSYDKRFQRETMDAIYKSTISKIFACCFSEELENMLMWSHYANSHRGVCLVFEFGYLFPTSGLTAVEIKYSDKPIPLSVPENFGPDPTPLTEHRLRQAFVGNKLEQWSYEREIRLISSKGGKNPFEPQSLAGIVFGARTPPARRDVILELAKKNYPHATLVDAKLNPTRGAIEIGCFPNSLIQRNAIVIVGDPGAHHTALYAKIDGDCADGSSDFAP